MARGWRHTRVVANAVAVDDLGRVLLVRRGRAPHKGRWTLPGGFLDDGEGPERAVLREVREETGLAARVRGLVGVYGGRRRDPRGPTVCVAYLLRAHGEPRAADDAAEARWFPLAEVPARLGFDHARILEDARRRA